GCSSDDDDKSQLSTKVKLQTIDDISVLALITEHLSPHDITSDFTSC
ncbi:unnamed protein product, partial [Rotaria magnacalcarata]